MGWHVFRLLVGREDNMLTIGRCHLTLYYFPLKALTHTLPFSYVHLCGYMVRIVDFHLRKWWVSFTRDTNAGLNSHFACGPWTPKLSLTTTVRGRMCSTCALPSSPVERKQSVAPDLYSVLCQVRPKNPDMLIRQVSVRLSKPKEGFRKPSG